MKIKKNFFFLKRKTTHYFHYYDNPYFRKLCSTRQQPGPKQKIAPAAYIIQIAAQSAVIIRTLAAALLGYTSDEINIFRRSERKLPLMKSIASK